MLSMTGYGSGVAAANSYEARVDLRVVNHKQIDVRIRGYGLSPKMQAAIDASCRKELLRGRADINVQVSRLEAKAEDLLDMNRARVAWKALTKLSADLGAPPPSLDTLVRIPGLVVTSVDEEAQEGQLEAVEIALGRALNTTCTMRELEGRVLTEDMRTRLEALGSHATAIEMAAPSMTANFREALARRINALSPEGHHLDPERLEREVVMFAARADITEETVRLKSHLAQLEQLFAATTAVGKRIDFLLQEVSREVNTIASKVTDATIAQTIVEMKSEVARLREQALNIL